MHARTPEPAHEPALVTGLRSPLCYPHPVERVHVIETHISWVLLAGEYAYKLKKPVDLGFLDFSTLALRRHYCDEELRLNRRTAPALYVDVVPVTGSTATPRMAGDGPAIEYAVRMRRFAQDDLLHERARRGLLAPADIDALAACVSRFHASAERFSATDGTAAGELRLALDNVEALRELDPGLSPATLDALEAWTVREHEAVAGALQRRRAEGFVRECHGDLHLGNLVMLEGKPVAFDCIEFSEELRRIDVMSDVAFVVMDLHSHGLPRYAARFLDGYLAATGDYAGLEVLRFFSVYRALVRAKVIAIGARQAEPGSARAAALADLDGHMRLAVALAQRGTPALTLMHGRSGSGKSTVALRLVEEQGAIRLRSDVERKRMHGLDASARAAAPPGEGLYSASRREAVYARLATLAGTVLAAGYPVVVDAAFLARMQRDRFRELARAAGCAFHIVTCVAPDEVLRERVAVREAARADASDAGLAVLESQADALQPVAGDELVFQTVIDTATEMHP